MKPQGCERGDMAGGRDAAASAQAKRGREVRKRERPGAELGAPSMMAASRPKVIVDRDRDDRGQLLRISLTAPTGWVIDALRCVVGLAPARLPRRRKEGEDRNGGDDRQA